jgi:hypothetical protein
MPWASSSVREPLKGSILELLKAAWKAMPLEWRVLAKQSSAIAVKLQEAQ